MAKQKTEGPKANQQEGKKVSDSTPQVEHDQPAVVKQVREFCSSSSKIQISRRRSTNGAARVCCGC